jgi:hypothetical protein
MGRAAQAVMSALERRNLRPSLFFSCRLLAARGRGGGHHCHTATATAALRNIPHIFFFVFADKDFFFRL